MSGHNKWSKVKHVKGPADAKRGKLFTKLLREIHVAARLHGSDPDHNPRLRAAILECRSNNMPKDTMERAIKKGSGASQDGSEFEQITYEAYGPGGVAILIECLTDNRNRTVGDLRSLLTRNGGNLGETGCVGWMFAKKGLISVGKNGTSENQIMELALDSGADDVSDDGDGWEIISAPDKHETVRTALEKAGIKVESSSVLMVPNNTIELQGESAQQMLRLVDLLEDLDDVQKVHSNFDLSDDELAKLM